MRDSLLLLGAGLVAFGWSLAGGFHFDDYALFSNPDVISWTSTRPLTNLTFWLNQQLGGSNPLGYHAFNLALHLATVLLLRSALSRVVPARIALIAALLFAVHPTQSEPVNYIFARGSLLATLLCVASLRSWSRLVTERTWRFRSLQLLKEGHGPTCSSKSIDSRPAANRKERRQDQGFASIYDAALLPWSGRRTE